MRWSGEVAPGDFISIDPPDAPQGTYGNYAYPKAGEPAKLAVPTKSGAYLVRYHLAADHAVTATAPLTVTAVSATLTAAARVDAGKTVTVSWSGPGNPTDFISIDKRGASDGVYGPYAYPNAGNPLTLTAPDEPGDFEIRYHLGADYTVVGRIPLGVGQVGAALTAPDSAPAGAAVEVNWSGPNDPQDFVSIDAVDAAAGSYGPYAYTAKGNPLRIQSPDAPGNYLLRYHTGQTWSVLASRPLTLTETGAALTAPAEVVARRVFEVAWQGPNNEGDFVTLVPVATEPGHWGRSNGYTQRGNPVRIEADAAPGDYEVR